MQASPPNRRTPESDPREPGLSQVAVRRRRQASRRLDHPTGRLPPSPPHTHENYRPECRKSPHSRHSMSVLPLFRVAIYVMYIAWPSSAAFKGRQVWHVVARRLGAWITSTRDTLMPDACIDVHSRPTQTLQKTPPCHAGLALLCRLPPRCFSRSAGGSLAAPPSGSLRVDAPDHRRQGRKAARRRDDPGAGRLRHERVYWKPGCRASAVHLRCEQSPDGSSAISSAG